MADGSCMVEVVNQTESTLESRLVGQGGRYVGEVSPGGAIMFGEPCGNGSVAVHAPVTRAGRRRVRGEATLVAGETVRIVLRE